MLRDAFDLAPLTGEVKAAFAAGFAGLRTPQPAHDFEAMFSPEWDGGYDTDASPIYGPHWRRTCAPGDDALLDAVGPYDAAAHEEMAARRPRGVGRIIRHATHQGHVVSNSLALAIHERRSEIGLLHAVGRRDGKHAPCCASTLSSPPSLAPPWASCLECSSAQAPSLPSRMAPGPPSHGHGHGHGHRGRWWWRRCWRHRCVAPRPAARVDLLGAIAST